jgi:A/G-specific adenine glycosylase
MRQDSSESDILDTSALLAFFPAEVECEIMQPLKCETIREIQSNVVAWFDQFQRDLPWRRDYLPYAVWISEIMLQQTQVKTVLPYYERWMARFPDISSVAGASEDLLLKHWEGLGYYSRARNIRRTAQILVQELGGRLPEDYPTLRKLPGIGSYTASAILSLAFNQDYPVVDGNVKRVFSRLFDISRPVNDRESLRFIEESANTLLPPGKSRSFNQGLMELGAVVCVPRNPHCTLCPIEKECRSRLLGIESARPVRSPPRRIQSIDVAVGVLVSKGRIFIQKRPPEGLMPLLWEFPGGKVKNGETPEEALVREFMEELDVRIGNLEKLGVIRHSYTSFRVTLHAYRCRFEPGHQRPVLRSAVDSKWVSRRELLDYPFPAANQKLIRML